MTDRHREDDRIVAVALLTAEEKRNLGTGLRRLYPVTDAGDFADLLQAIDQATRGTGRDQRKPRLRIVQP